MRSLLVIPALLVVLSCTGRAQPTATQEIVFHSGAFRVVGDLILPQGSGPHPVILFVHGDGPNNRTAGGTYPPIMERMRRTGYATFAWDKPGTGESTGRIDRRRLQEQRTRIVLDAIAAIKQRPEIDASRIGLWGISQAGYVMPRVIDSGEEIAFMIAVSCPGVAGVDQGAYLVTAQAVCAGLPEKDTDHVEHLIRQASWAQSYDEYVRYKSQMADYPVLTAIAELGFRIEVAPEDRWHADDLTGEYFWNPISVIERTTIPVLAFFGENDTQIDPIQGAEAYRTALERAGNPHYRVEMIPGTDHNIIVSRTGCLEERRRRPRSEWTNYPGAYLDTLEEWLRELRL
jgi:pimeloyl-ACP methyl ester carboxylesterase